VGLLAEEFEPVTGRTLGNFPQAYSHVGLINYALNLSRQKGTVGRHHRLCDPKRWLSGEIERTISYYLRTIDFGSSDHQNNDYSERARIRPAHFGIYGCGTWVPIQVTPQADFPGQFGSFSLITACRAKTSTARCAIALWKKATFVIHRRG
jgi:hypothetical protein